MVALAVGSLAAAAALWAATFTTAATASADPGDAEFIENVKSLGLEVGPEDEKYVLQIAHSVCVLLDAKGSADEIADAMTDEGATTEQAQGFVDASAAQLLPPVHRVAANSDPTDHVVDDRCPALGAS